MGLALALVFASAFSLALGVCALGGGRDPLRRRLADAARGAPPADRARAERLGPRLRAALARLGGEGRRPGARAAVRTRERLAQAGFRRRSALSVYLGSRILGALLGASAALLAQGLLPLSQGAHLGALVAASGLGFVLPGLGVDALRRRRQRRLRLGLPDAIDLLVVCLEAGLSLRAALHRVAGELEQTHRVLAQELRLVVLETHAGKSHAEALRGLAQRTGMAEIASFVAMLVQTDRFGTDLASTFRVHSEALRTQRLHAAEEAAQKAPVKMLVPAGLFIFPATLLVTIGPGILRILEALR